MSVTFDVLKGSNNQLIFVFVLLPRLTKADMRLYLLACK